MTLQPLGDRIVARPVEAETKTASGFLLTEGSKDKTQTAEVVAVGKDVKEIKVGDTVIHSEYKVDRFKQNDDEYLIAKEEDILAVIKG